MNDFTRAYMKGYKEALAKQEQFDLNEDLKAWQKDGSLIPAKQEQGEPVAEGKVKQLVKQCTHRDVDGNWYVDGVQLVHATCFAIDAITRRNTTPQQRKPLTFEQIEACFQDGGIWGVDGKHLGTTAQGLHDFARAIEAAHGIKE